MIYANIDGFDPAEAACSGDVGQLDDGRSRDGARAIGPSAERGELDRWILSELNRTAAAVVERMDAYDNFAACERITEFVDALSNWYVRRSRDRFWARRTSRSPDKLDAYWTLYECLLTTSKLVAPFVPFLAEAMWQNLARRVRRASASRERPSVRLSRPAMPRPIDEQLSERMKLVREIVSLGRSARMANKLKVRQPLAKVEVILADATHQAWLEEHAELMREELNVKQVEFTEDAEQYITYPVLPNFKRLGPRLGKLLPACKAALGKADGGKLLAELTATRQSDARHRRREGRARQRRHSSPPASQARLGGGARTNVRRRAGDGADAGAGRRRAWPAISSAWCRIAARNWGWTSPTGSKSASSGASAELQKAIRADSGVHLRRDAGGEADVRALHGVDALKQKLVTRK